MPTRDPDDEAADAAIDAANQGGAASLAALAHGLPAVGPDHVEETHGDAIDNVVPTYGYQQLPVVGLGGSAGGIQALKAFFMALPPETGTAYVVILHLSPEHASTLPALLQNVTALPVKAVEDGERLQPDHVYVIPPARQLTVINGHLRLSPLESERGRRVVVDLFFRSLADAHGPRATAVVLSGADGDGAIGLKRIKERGGLTIAQEPAEAEYDGMPRSSIATGMVDWVLHVADMPARILGYGANGGRLRLPPEDGPQPAKPANPPLDEEEASLREVLSFLRMRTGNDFTYYKRATILRRIARRMQVNGVSTLPEYLLTLRTHAGEAAALLQDLLISVTNFFRDREAFAALEARIPDLFAGKGPEDTVRVWCAACASGEEPYSMAMLLTEHARTLAHPPTVQVFGCDLDAQSIRTARAGVYPSAIAADVSEERIARFFIKEPRGYRVRRELREIVLFAEHDLLKDAPFSRQDLVSCRNLLIYLEREAQTRALEIFHFALKPDGLLFLGSAESVDEERGLFAVLDKKHRIFVRRPVMHVGLPVPTGTGTLLRALQAQSREAPVVPNVAFNRVATAPFAPVPILSPSEERAALADLHFRLIERYAPPSVIVDAEGDIVHLSENAGRFLRPSGGQPTTNLLRTVHPDLRMELHTALLRVAETNTPVECFGARIETEGRSRTVDLRVAPAAELAPGYVLVSFAAREPDLEAVTDSAVSARPEAEAVVRHLERELEQARMRLRDTIERAGATEEEYKSSNEELQSMNEELRSASEELETSREELQSINEELTTVNLQLRYNVEELGQSNSDLHNLMNATSIATVFLDRELKVMRYTPEAVAIFHLIPSDAGRPLADLKQRIDYSGLEADARQVLRTLVPVEREVGDGGGWFLVRLSPYRSLEERIEGVVLTFVDITERKQAEDSAMVAERQFRSFVEATADTVYKMNADWSEMRVLEGKRFLADTEHPTRTWLETYIPPADHPSVLASIREAIRARGPFELEHRVIRADGTVGWTFSRAISMLNAQGEIVEWIGAASDVTERKRAEEARRESEEKYRTLFNSMDQGYCIIQVLLDANGRATDFRYVEVNPAFEKHNGLTNAVGKTIRELAPDIEGKWMEIYGRVAASGESVRIEESSPALDGRTFDLYAFRVGAPAERTVAVLFTDITERARAGEALRASEEKLAVELADTRQLQHISSALVEEGNTDALYTQILEAACAVLRADSASLQILVPERNALFLLAHNGFTPASARHWEWVRTDDASSCGQAMKDGKRIIVPDVDRWEYMAGTEDLAHYRLSGIRATQSTRLVSRAGRLIGMISTHWADVHEPSGRELGLFDVLARQAADLIERKQVEDALAESTARLQTAVALAGLGTCRWDWSTHEMRGNDQRFLMCGLDPAAGVIPEEQYRGMLHPEDRETVWPRILRDLEERGEYAAEYRFMLPDGVVRWLSEAGRVIDRQPDGRPWHIESALFDITTHREAEAAIAESELRFRTLANALPQLIWTNETDGKANYFNQRWYEYTGLSFEQSDGPGWQAVVHPDDAPAAMEKWQRALAAGEIFDTEYRLRRADGAHRWHLGRNVPLKDEAGRVLGWFGSATDIHDLKEAERETERARVEVEAAGAAKDHFLAVLSHELRTPLMPITMALAVLARRPDLPEAVTKMFAMIQRNVELEARFIDDLLDVTRIERGKMEITRVDINLYEAIERAVEVSTPDIEAKGQRLTVSLEGPTCPYHGDFARLQQVFWNLLKNASKFTPPGGAIEVRSRCQVGEQVVVEVIDTGIGLEADTIERIFRPFEQASVSITREFGGLGLGLAIAKATVEAHGGTLRVSSSGAGQGATFTVSLPHPPTAGGTVETTA